MSGDSAKKSHGDLDSLVEHVARAIYEAAPEHDAGEALDGFQVTPAGPLSWRQVMDSDDGTVTRCRDQARAALGAVLEHFGALGEFDRALAGLVARDKRVPR